MCVLAAKAYLFNPSPPHFLSFFILLFLFGFLETRSCSVALVGLKLTIESQTDFRLVILPQPLPSK